MSEGGKGRRTLAKTGTERVRQFITKGGDERGEGHWPLMAVGQESMRTEACLRKIMCNRKKNRRKVTTSVSLGHKQREREFQTERGLLYQKLQDGNPAQRGKKREKVKNYVRARKKKPGVRGGKVEREKT